MAKNNDLVYVGRDDWSRRLFKTKSGSILVDVDGELHTRTPSWGEPISPVGIATPDLKDKKS